MTLWAHPENCYLGDNEKEIKTKRKKHEWVSVFCTSITANKCHFSSSILLWLRQVQWWLTAQRNSITKRNSAALCGSAFVSWIKLFHYKHCSSERGDKRNWSEELHYILLAGLPSLFSRAKDITRLTHSSFTGWGGRAGRNWLCWNVIEAAIKAQQRRTSNEYELLVLSITIAGSFLFFFVVVVSDNLSAQLMEKYYTL